MRPVYQGWFADATSSYENAEYVVFGVPFDATSSYRTGSRWAPQAIREASYNFEVYNPHYDLELSNVPVYDAGNLDVEVGVEDALLEVETFARRLYKDGKLPIMLGGEHSLTYPMVKTSGVDSVLVLDAHLDLREEYGGTRWNHASVSRRILEDVTNSYASIGVRSGSKKEYEYAREEEILFYSSDKVRDEGIKPILEEIKETLGDTIYLSVDMDALDPGFAPGLGTPEPFGLTPWDVREVIRFFAPRIIGLDVVETTPEYDNGETASLAAKLIREFIAASTHAKQRR